MIKAITGKLNDAYLAYKYPEENKITTHLTTEEKIKLVQLASAVDGKTFCEIGSYVGASSCFIAAGVQKKKQDGKLYCIDTWANDSMSEGKRDTYQEFLRNTSRYAETIVPLRGTSVSVAKKFTHNINFLFVDGDHSYEGCLEDWKLWSAFLVPGSVAVFHDISWAEGVQRVIAEEVAPRAKKQGRLPNLYWAWM